METQQFRFIDDEDINRTFGPHAGAIRAGLQALIAVDLMAQGMEFDMTDTKRYGVYTTRRPV